MGLISPGAAKFEVTPLWGKPFLIACDPSLMIPRPPVLRPRGNNGALRRSDVHCWPASAVLGQIRGASRSSSLGWLLAHQFELLRPTHVVACQSASPDR